VCVPVPAHWHFWSIFCFWASNCGGPNLGRHTRSFSRPDGDSCRSPQATICQPPPRPHGPRPCFEPTSNPSPSRNCLGRLFFFTPPCRKVVDAASDDVSGCDVPFEVIFRNLSDSREIAHALHSPPVSCCADFIPFVPFWSVSWVTTQKTIFFSPPPSYSIRGARFSKRFFES